MTTAVHEKPKAAPLSQPAKVIFQGNVAIDEIVVTTQVRKKFDEAAHRDLTENIRSLGVISPITLRPRKDAYQLVAGERRYRAAKAAGLKEIPARVLELDDQQALEYQAAENIHRKDLTPIEEARAFKQLTQPVGTSVPKYTVEQLAKLVDKSTAYVYRALALLELPTKAIDAIEAGEITPAHGHQILRVPPFEREAIVKDLLENGYDGQIMTAYELKNQVEIQLGNDLSSAKFPKDKMFAGMSPCTTCPSNTGNQGALFDGAEKGQCLNKQCFTTKTEQYKSDFLEKVRLANLSAKFVEYLSGYAYDGMTKKNGYIVKCDFDAKKPPKGDFALLITSGFEIKIAVPKPKSKSDSSPAAKAAERAADPKEQFIQEAIAHAIYDAAAEGAKKLKMEKKDWVKLAIAAANDMPNELWAGILGVPSDSGTDKEFEKASEATLRAIVMANQRLSYNPTDADWKKLGVDVAKVKKEATKEAESEWAESYGRKHLSIANAGSEVLCGLKTLNYKTATEQGIAVPTIEKTTCPACKAEDKKRNMKPRR